MHAQTLNKAVEWNSVALDHKKNCVDVNWIIHTADTLKTNAHNKIMNEKELTSKHKRSMTTIKHYTIDLKQDS